MFKKIRPFQGPRGAEERRYRRNNHHLSRIRCSLFDFAFSFFSLSFSLFSSSFSLSLSRTRFRHCNHGNGIWNSSSPLMAGDTRPQIGTVIGSTWLVRNRSFLVPFTFVFPARRKASYPSPFLSTQWQKTKQGRLDGSFANARKWFPFLPYLQFSQFSFVTLRNHPSVLFLHERFCFRSSINRENLIRLERLPVIPIARASKTSNVELFSRKIALNGNNDCVADGGCSRLFLFPD